MAEEIFNRGNVPHQNRLELLAPPFVSRQKVEHTASACAESNLLFVVIEESLSRGELYITTATTISP